MLYRFVILYQLFIIIFCIALYFYLYRVTPVVKSINIFFRAIGYDARRQRTSFSFALISLIDQLDGLLYSFRISSCNKIKANRQTQNRVSSVKYAIILPGVNNHREIAVSLSLTPKF